MSSMLNSTSPDRARPLSSQTTRTNSMSPSPSRLRRDVNSFESSEDPVFRSAARKIADACNRFDRARDGMFLKAFEGTAMDKVLLRDMLKRGLNCKLTEAEAESAMQLFDRDGNGVCDGVEFILTFYKFRYEHSKKLLTERIAAERRITEAAMARIDKRKEDFENKSVIEINFDYSEEDRKSAMDKITTAAFKYDRLMPGTVQLNAFDGAVMTPKVFKEQLKHVFNIKLNPKELGALMNYFDRDGDGCVNCAEFLVAFFRIGFDERAKFVRGERERKKRLEAERIAAAQLEKEQQEAKNKMKVSYSYTVSDKNSAFEKLRMAAKLYNKDSATAPSMKAFDGAFMEPHVFKEQLRRVFNMKLTPPELGALMHAFDDDGDGTINCAEFTKNFSKMGFAERELELKEYHEKQKHAEEMRRERERKKQEEQDRKNALQVTFDYSEADFDSAIAKLTDAAWKYDKNMPGAVSLSAFQGMEMEPHVFKEQMKRVFNIILSPPELGALMSYFDKNGDGRISCPEFIIQFIKVGFAERSRRRQYWRRYDEKRRQQQRQEEIRKQIAAEEKNALKVTYDFEEQDFQSAIQKLTDAATKYDRSTAGAVGLDAFEGEAMLPHVFKEQLKRVFNIRLTPPELGALMSYFDKDRDGSVNCAEFLIQFFRTGFEERSKVRAHWRELKRQRIEKELKQEEERRRENEQRAMASVDFDFTEEDFDSALAKIVNMCHRFDRRQLGPAGLKPFEASTVTPSEFREMMKRAFDLILTPAELGAMVTYWDPTMRGLVSCQAFLNSFTQMRVKCETFKNKPGEAEKLREYHAELKEQYKARIQKQMLVNDDSKLRPWRLNSVRSFSHQPAPKRPYPSTPLQKIRRRMAVARKTGRLDLSTEIIMPTSADDEGGDGSESVAQSSLTASLVQKWKEPEMVRPGTVNVDKRQTVEYMLDAIPEEVFAIKGLAELWLCNNPLSTISPKLADLDTLQVLSLTNVGLRAIPLEVSGLIHLRRLYLQQNSISEIPEDFSSLSLLTDLNISRNKFVGEIPDVVMTFRDLAYMDISYNSFASVPVKIMQLKTLALLNITGNGITAIPHNIPRRMPSLLVIGVDTGAHSRKFWKPENFDISKEEELELISFIKHRAKKPESKEEKNGSTKPTERHVD